MCRSLRRSLKGNLIDVAVAFVLGVAFAALVTATVTDLDHADRGGGRRQAELRRPELHDQRLEVRLRRLAQQADHVPPGHGARALPGDRALVMRARAFERDEPASVLRPCPYCFENINVAGNAVPALHV